VEQRIRSKEQGKNLPENTIMHSLITDNRQLLRSKEQGKNLPENSIMHGLITDNRQLLRSKEPGKNLPENSIMHGLITDNPTTVAEQRIRKYRWIYLASKYFALSFRYYVSN
jgi:hypothetical protein